MTILRLLLYRSHARELDHGRARPRNRPAGLDTARSAGIPGHIADLYAWLQFLARPNAGDAVIRDAKNMVAQTIGDF